MSEENWQSLASSWEFNPWIIGWLLLCSFVYFQGWIRLNQRNETRSSPFSTLRLASFHLGLLTICIAIQSPLDAMATFSLRAHMVQHLLLIIAAPLLLLWSWPMLPLISGLPKDFRRNWFTPFANWPPIRQLIARLFHPVSTWLLFVIGLWGWHAPQAYQLALESTTWHRIEHACFLFSAMLFWFPIVRPYPYRPKWTTWLLVPYLVLAGIQGTALSGILTFADDVLYPHYETMPALFGVSPLIDQAMAGALMWVPMSISFLIALVWIVGQQFVEPSQFDLRPSSDRRNSEPRHSGHKMRLADDAGTSPYEKVGNGSDSLSRSHRTRRVPVANLPAEQRTSLAVTSANEPGHPSNGSDRLPFHLAFPPVHVLSSFFKSAVVRKCFRVVVLLLTVCVVVDGIAGPQVAPLNLAGVLPWIHWRGLLVIALVLGGNFFCMVCPFTALNGMIGAAGPSKARQSVGFSKLLRWPDQLRTKWLAVGILLLFYWAYECFALWDRPKATSIIIVCFFAGAYLLNRLFREAPFCKYVCPIGQFNFVQSLLSPSTVAVASTSVCSRCSTRDCIIGNEEQSGCQLELFQPAKIGNMDCTYCFDCSDACPHDNVELVQIERGSDLYDDPHRAGIGRLSQRFDIAALIIVLFFAALVNAAWMTSPLLELEDYLVQSTGGSRVIVVTLGMLCVLVLLPAFLMYAIGHTGQQWVKGKITEDANQAIKTYLARRAPILVPLGLSMWLAHYLFHLVTTWDSALIAFQRAFAQLSGRNLEIGPIACACCRADSIAWLLPMEFLFLAVGLCSSFVILFHVTKRESDSRPGFVRSMLMWTVFLATYYAVCLWIVLQPMQMRGAIG
ncbi:MAG: cytochrome c oxidase assembly protein [Planctomycetaceae bacterium]